MKIRNGYVANSSSSSYVLRLPKDRHLSLSEYESYFGINESDPKAREEIIVGLWTAIRMCIEEDDFYSYRYEDVVFDPKDYLEYYAESGDSKVAQFLDEVEHPEKYPNTKIVGFTVSDHEGALVDYGVSSTLACPYDDMFTGDNICAFNEH